MFYGRNNSSPFLMIAAGRLTARIEIHFIWIFCRQAKAGNLILKSENGSLRNSLQL